MTNQELPPATGTKFGRLILPYDDRLHPDARDEWWYFTGHLSAEDGSVYGYELTIFKYGNMSYKLGPFKIKKMYAVNLAITFESENRFVATTQVLLPFPFNRISDRQLNIRLGKTRVETTGQFQYRIQGDNRGVSLDLSVRATKPPVVHGDGGIVEMGKSGKSYYYSLTRLETIGSLTVEGAKKSVKGLSWMDRQWGSWDWDKLSGWDWMSIQLDNGDDLMVYSFHNDEGKIATIYTKDEKTISTSDFTLERKELWTSGQSKIVYPSGWQLFLPEIELEVSVKPTVQDQEVYVEDRPDKSYWEGSCRIEGTMKGKPVSGVAYVELSGYANI